MRKVVLVIVIVQTILSSSEGDPSPECGPPPPSSSSKYDMEWLESYIKEGMYISLHSKLEMSHPLPKPKTENYKNRKMRKCFDVTMRINDPPQNKTPILGSSLYFDGDGPGAFFIIDTPTPQNALNNKFTYFGDFWDWATDNKTFMGWSGCLYERNIRSFLVASVEPSLDQSTRDDLIKRAEKELGIDPSAISDGSETYIFHQMRESPVCTPESTNGHWHWHSGSPIASNENDASNEEEIGNQVNNGFGSHAFGNEGFFGNQQPHQIGQNEMHPLFQQLMPAGSQGNTVNHSGSSGFVRYYNYSYGSSNSAGGRSTYVIGDVSSNSDFANVALAETNQYRVKHGALQLSLDSKLNEACQSYAEKLAQAGMMEHSCDTCNDYGENLYVMGGKVIPPADAARRAVKSWYDEESLYDYNTATFNGATAHFTALVWKNTTTMGFGLATNKDTKKTFVVARYVPPGNVLGLFKENVGGKLP